MPTEFDCEGCLAHVITPIYRVPHPYDPAAHRYCAACMAFATWPELALDRLSHGEFVQMRRTICGELLPSRAEASYRDRRQPEASCEHCGRLYRGPAVYCSLICALADAC